MPEIKEINAPSAKSSKSVSKEGAQIFLASELIKRGARMHILERETNLSYDRLSRLYHEIHKKSPPKGMLPFAPEWYLKWHANIHSTIFYSFHRSILAKNPEVEPIQASIKAYDLYIDHGRSLGKDEPELSFSRAWNLVRFVNAKMLQMTACSSCGVEHITHAWEPDKFFICPLCNPPGHVKFDSVAKPKPKGKTRAQKSEKTLKGVEGHVQQ